MLDKLLKHKRMLAILLGLAFLLMASGFSLTAKVVNEEKEGLVKVGSKAQLEELLDDYYSSQMRQNNYWDVVYEEADFGMVRLESAKSADVAEAPQSANTAADSGGGYSTTNIQVQGVDESDKIKTDGKYIYKINDNQLLIVQAIPADSMQVVARLSFADTNFSPSELYIDNNRLVVLGNYWALPTASPAVPYEEKRIRMIEADSAAVPYPYYNNQEGMRLMVYDTTNIKDPKKIREFDMEGSYLTSRKINSYVYIVTNKYANYPSPVLPVYRDDAFSEESKEVSLDRIWYCPGEVYPNYVLMGGVNVADISQAAQVEAYLGQGENVYASLNNMYIAVSSYAEDATKIFKFALNKATFTFDGQGEVKGHVLNQFSMDEKNDNFRIATTSGDMWGSRGNISQNNLYILDKDLKPLGQIEGIAPGEKIYSARFMGDRAYMVTFRTVDPFFVIDVKDPTQPQVLGQLKIPGYSDYLHPYDENHVIGFGKDTIELKSYANESQAYYLGMKISIFDVTNVEQPVEQFKTIIGDRGTESALLNDHKALLFSPGKNLLAFPITVMELKGKPVVESNRDYSYPNYGEFTFQGAYVYHLDLNTGFTLKGKVTHISSNEYKNAGDYWYDSDKNIERLLFIGDTLYSASNTYISANDLASLVEKGRSALK